jgi:hypothetical protein
MCTHRLQTEIANNNDTHEKSRVRSSVLFAWANMQSLALESGQSRPGTNAKIFQDICNY